MTSYNALIDDRLVTVPGETPSQRVARDLRTRLDADEWAPGDRLPSVGQLSEFYGVARATVVKAIRQLASEGLVVTAPSWGTFRAGPDQALCQNQGSWQAEYQGLYQGKRLRRSVPAWLAGVPGHTRAALLACW